MVSEGGSAGSDQPGAADVITGDDVGRSSAASTLGGPVRQVARNGRVLILAGVSVCECYIGKPIGHTCGAAVHHRGGKATHAGKNRKAGYWQ